jgi:hypothetical protein
MSPILISCPLKDRISGRSVHMHPTLSVSYNYDVRVTGSKALAAFVMAVTEKLRNNYLTYPLNCFT